MALTQTAYPGNDLTITCDGSKTKWREFVITFNEDTVPTNTADGDESEIVRTKKWIEGRCTGLVGSANTPTSLPMPGDAIADAAVAAGADSMIPSLTGYNNIKCVAPVEYNFSGDLSTYSFNFRSGVIA